MKNLILSGLLLFAGLDSVSAARIRIHRSGSGDGVNYNKVSETHRGGFLGFGELHTLSCTGAGATSCGWSSAINIGGFSSDVIALVVMERITGGQTTGSFRYNNLVYVSWVKDSAGAITIDMTDEI